MVLQQKSHFPPLKYRNSQEDSNLSVPNDHIILPSESNSNDKNVVATKECANIMKNPNPALAPTISIGVDPIPMKKVAYSDGIPGYLGRRLRWIE